MTSTAECTSASASWCPIHGDCRCDREHDNLDDPECPLHNADSKHAQEPSFEDHITCPACGHVDHATVDYPEGLRHDGDEVETYCVKCDLRLSVLVRVERSFKSVVVEQRPPAPSPVEEPKASRCPYCKPGAPCYSDDPKPDPATCCPECEGRGWHHGDCHPREECGVCEGTGRASVEPSTDGKGGVT